MSILKKIPNIVLAILSGLLLTFAWPPFIAWPLSFVAFTLLFIVEDRVPKKKWRFFLISFVAMLVWNIGTTYWVFNATPIAIAAFIESALLMCIPWRIYRSVKRHYGLGIGLVAFVSAWLGLEWLHFNWELAWPWLTLGNVFAKTPNVVQWYEYTGAGGGTLWVLLFNVLFFLMLKFPAKAKQYVIYAICLLVVPILGSYIVKSKYFLTKSQPLNVSIIQPNFDPYALDWSMEEQQKQLSTLERLIQQGTEQHTDFVLVPESGMPGNVWQQSLDSHQYIRTLRSAMSKGNNTSIIIGADVLKRFKPNEEVTATARYNKPQKFYYDVYNAAIQIQQNKPTDMYIKSKLVPFVERMPYPKVLKFLKNMNIDLGGIGGTRATQPEVSLFQQEGKKVGAAVCYESIFGDYMNNFVQKGAEAMFIITNDGWWKDTSGYRQHLHYARLRAIETRRDIARSANTGVSAIINHKGEIVSKTNWAEETILKGQVHLRKQQTFYTRYGDVIYRVGALIAIIITLITIVKKYTNNFKYRA